jgi:predicted RNA-binding Zn-ribbon protein involved in translation (DUF1610 family)
MVSFSFFSVTIAFALTLFVFGQSQWNLWPGIIALAVYLGFFVAFAVAALLYRRNAISVLREIRQASPLKIVSPLEKGLNVLSFAFALGFAGLGLSSSNPYVAAPALGGMALLSVVALRIAKKAGSGGGVLTCPNCKGELEPYWVACPFCRWDLMNSFSKQLYHCPNCGKRMTYRGTHCYECRFSFGFCPECGFSIAKPAQRCHICKLEVWWCGACGLPNPIETSKCRSCGEGRGMITSHGAPPDEDRDPL